MPFQFTFSVGERIVLEPGEYEIIIRERDAQPLPEPAPESVPLVVSLGLNRTIRVGELVSFTAVVSGGSPPYVFSWDLGDGSTLVTDSSSTVYRYSSEGTVFVSVMVSDLDSGTAAASLLVTVLPENLFPGGPMADYLNLPFDTIPTPINQYTLEVFSPGGLASNPGTFTPARLPVAGDVVVIRPGGVLTWDVISDVQIQVVVGPGGRLQNSPAMNTRLTIGTGYGMLLVYDADAINPRGVLDWRVNPGFLAEIVIASTPFHLDDPDQYGTGLIALGECKLMGTAKTPYVRLAAETAIGATTLSLAQPVSGWNVGDQLVLPDTRQLSPYEWFVNYVWNGDVRTIISISADNRTVDVAPPLTYAHLGFRDTAQVLERLPHVCNLTRNVVVRSGSPSGVRGHCLFGYRSNTDIQQTAFVSLGRTKNTALDPVLNHSGRYPVHFHHNTGPAIIPANGYQYTFVGNSIHDPDLAHLEKWGMSFHDSHYGQITDNVIFNWTGSGITAEDGSESRNVVARNFICLVRGDFGWHIPIDSSGSHIAGGIWSRGFNNYIRDNAVANVPDHAGYMYYAKYLGDVLIPAAQGQLPSVTVDMNATPILEFARNEVYGATSTGLSIWWLGDKGAGPVSIGQSLFQDFRCSHIFQYGIYLYEMNNCLFDRTVMRNQLGISLFAVGVQGSEYAAFATTFANADIQGFEFGIKPPTNAIQPAVVPHPPVLVFTVRDSFLNNDVNVIVEIPSVNWYQADPVGARDVVLRNVRHGSLSTWNVKMSYYDGPVSHLIDIYTVKVFDHQGTVGANYQVYFREQAAGTVVPQRVVNADGTHAVLSSPQAGLTNQQNWDSWEWELQTPVDEVTRAVFRAATGAWQRVAIAGAVAPATAVDGTPLKFDGLVRALP